jgi:hypothetical protein
MRYTQESFLARLRRTPEGCWEWTGWIGKWGYGCVSGTGTHRFAWELFVGPIPSGMEVDHLCFNPPCVRIEHLRLLPGAENHRNQRSASKTHCKNGHEFTPENTYIYVRRYTPGPQDDDSLNRNRQCRKCNAQAAAQYQARKKAGVPRDKVVRISKTCVVCGQDFTPLRKPSRARQTCGPTCKSALLSIRNAERKAA